MKILTAMRCRLDNRCVCRISSYYANDEEYHGCAAFDQILNSIQSTTQALRETDIKQTIKTINNRRFKNFFLFAAKIGGNAYIILLYIMQIIQILPSLK